MCLGCNGRSRVNGLTACTELQLRMQSPLLLARTRAISGLGFVFGQKTGAYVLCQKQLQGNMRT